MSSKNVITDVISIDEQAFEKSVTVGIGTG